METLFQTGNSNKELGLGSSWKKETYHLQQHFEKYVSVITGISYHKVIITLYLTVVVTCCRAVAMLHTLGVSVIWVVATWQHSWNQRKSSCFDFEKQILR